MLHGSVVPIATQTTNVIYEDYKTHHWNQNKLKEPDNTKSTSKKEVDIFRIII
jgi:hypothetical protein